MQVEIKNLRPLKLEPSCNGNGFGRPWFALALGDIYFY